jgi:hypothetical protein
MAINLKIYFCADRFSDLLAVWKISIKNGQKRSTQILLENLKISFIKGKLFLILMIWLWQIFDDFLSIIYQYFVSFLKSRLVRFPLNQHSTIPFDCFIC